MGEELDKGIDLPDVNLIDEELLSITAEKLLSEAGENITKQSNAINDICDMLLKLGDPVQEEFHIKYLSKKYKINRQVFRDKLKVLHKSSDKVDMEIPDIELPEGVDEKLAKKTGFFKHKSQYYFITGNGLFRCSNFIIKPLFHIYSKNDNKRMIEITNEYGFTRILDIPSRNFVSIEQFQQSVFGEGNYIFFGTKIHFMKIIENMANEFPLVNELRTLGWQREGFYAFANGIFNGKYQQTDQYGITQHKKVKYFSPAFSVIYSDVREDDDEYENDRYFIWQQSPITFEQWTKLMIEVYGEKAIIAIAFLIASIFRDMIYEKYKIFPHLFLFGQKRSGKSQLAWSLSNLFFNNLPAFNLSSGTQVGFFRRLSRVKNAPVWFDEYNNDIDEKRFQSLKSAYDGMGHEKGKMTKDSRTEITKVNSSCIISGQYLPTRDDNALFTRSILLSFEEKKYSQEETEKYARLKAFELQGLSSITCEILEYREEIDKQYGIFFSEIMESLKDELLRENKAFDERLVRNFCSILAPVRILQNLTVPLKMNFEYERIYNLAKQMISELSAQISSSEALSNFWNMIEFMLDNRLIESGNDFKIQTVIGLEYVSRYDKKENQQWELPKIILFIRFSRIHPLYMEAHRKQFGKNGVDLVSLMHYIKHHHAYIGYKSSYRFNNQISSCYCFNYEILGSQINLDRIPLDDKKSETDQNNFIEPKKDETRPF
jgi:hypothetical protein